jgi:hypothetical protein
MPFPKINYCLICEDMRQELHRKSTLAGFYGVAPQVDIFGQDLHLPIAQLCFVLIAEQGEMGGTLSFTITNPNGQAIVNSGEKGLQLVPDQSQRRLNLAIAIAGIAFKEAGRYLLNIAVDGRSHYHTSFNVQKGLEIFSKPAS